MSYAPMRFIVLVFLSFSAAAAHAYVGPGLGLGVIGALLGTLLAVILAIAGLVWYPVKRMLKKKNPAGVAGTIDHTNTQQK